MDMIVSFLLGVLGGLCVLAFQGLKKAIKSGLKVMALVLSAALLLSGCLASTHGMDDPLGRPASVKDQDAAACEELVAPPAWSKAASVFLTAGSIVAFALTGQGGNIFAPTVDAKRYQSCMEFKGYVRPANPSLTEMPTIESPGL